MKKLIILMVVLLSSGCSPFRAANQPHEKDMSVLAAGVHRDMIVAELGTPVVTAKDEMGNLYDIFVFVDGYSTGVKSARAIFHGVADVFTLGLWELLATPIEGANSGTRMKVRIEYDQKNRVAKTEILEPKPNETTPKAEKENGGP